MPGWMWVGEHTNCADDGCTAIIGLGFEFGVQTGKPFDLSASRGQVVKRVGHAVGSCTEL